MKKILALVGAMLILTILLAGCPSQPGTPGSAATAGQTEAPGVAPAATPALASSSFPTGVNWRLFSYTDGKGGMSNVIGDQPITALFRADGTVTGSSGCNQYTAAYTTSRVFCQDHPGYFNNDGLCPGSDGPGVTILLADGGCSNIFC